MLKKKKRHNDRSPSWSNYYKSKQIKLSNKKAKIGRMDKNTQSSNILSMRDSLAIQRQLESERMEKDIPCKWKPEQSRSSWTNVRQNRLSQKKLTRDKEGLYIFIKNSIQQKDSNYKHLCTKWQTIKIDEANTERIQGRNRHFCPHSWRPQYPTHNHR